MYKKKKKKQIKYEFTHDTIIHAGTMLYRIRALVDIPKHRVFAGEKGGYIASEDNLSHTGAAWVADNAKVFGNGKVSGDALADMESSVYGDAKLYGNALLTGYSILTDHAKMYGDSRAYGESIIKDEASLYEKAQLRGLGVTLMGRAKVRGKSLLYDRAVVAEDAEVQDEASMYDHALLAGKAILCGDASLMNDAIVKDGVIKKSDDYVYLGPIGEHEDFLTFNRTTGTVSTDTFSGTIPEFKTYLLKTPALRPAFDAYKKAIKYFCSL